MLGVDGNRSNQVVEISPSRPKLGGTGGLKKGHTKEQKKGQMGSLVQ